MAVTLVFLGKLADHEGVPSRRIAAPVDHAALVAALAAPTVDLLQAGKVHLAVDGTVLADIAALSAHDGSEIALLPPVSGG